MITTGYFKTKLESAEKAAKALKDSARLAQVLQMKTVWEVYAKCLPLIRKFLDASDSTFRRDKATEYCEFMDLARSEPVLWKNLPITFCCEELKRAMDQAVHNRESTEKYISKEQLCRQYLCLTRLDEESPDEQERQGASIQMPVLYSGLNACLMVGNFVNSMDAKAAPIKDMCALSVADKPGSDSGSGDRHWWGESVKRVCKDLFMVSSAVELPGENLSLAHHRVLTSPESVYKLFRDHTTVGQPLIERASSAVAKIDAQQKCAEISRRAGAVAKQLVAQKDALLGLIGRKNAEDISLLQPEFDVFHDTWKEYERLTSTAEISSIDDPVLSPLVSISEEFHKEFTKRCNICFTAAQSKAQTGGAQAGVDQLNSDYSMIVRQWSSVFPTPLSMDILSHIEQGKVAKSMLPGKMLLEYFDLFQACVQSFASMHSAIPGVGPNFPKSSEEAKRLTATSDDFVSLDQTGIDRRDKVAGFAQAYSEYKTFLGKMPGQVSAALAAWLGNASKVFVNVMGTFLDEMGRVLDLLLEVLKQKCVSQTFEEIEASANVFPVPDANVHSVVRNRGPGHLKEQAMKMAHVLRKEACSEIEVAALESDVKVLLAKVLSESYQCETHAGFQVGHAKLCLAFSQVKELKDLGVSTGPGSPSHRALSAVFRAVVTQGFLIGMKTAFEAELAKAPADYLTVAASDDTERCRAMFLQQSSALLEATLSELTTDFKNFKDSPLRKDGHGDSMPDYVSAFAAVTELHVSALRYVMTMQAMVFLYKRLPKVTLQNIAPTTRVYNTSCPYSGSCAAPLANTRERS